MIELGIAQAQSQFTKILNKKVLIVDKKTAKKKAVLIPYEEYENMPGISTLSRDDIVVVVL